MITKILYCIHSLIIPLCSCHISRVCVIAFAVAVAIAIATTVAVAVVVVVDSVRWLWHNPYGRNSHSRSRMRQLFFLFL